MLVIQIPTVIVFYLTAVQAFQISLEITDHRYWCFVLKVLKSVKFHLNLFIWNQELFFNIVVQQKVKLLLKNLQNETLKFWEIFNFWSHWIFVDPLYS